MTMVEPRSSLKVKTLGLPTAPAASTTTAPAPEAMASVGQSDKQRLALLLGGPSSEKEVSLESARHVYNNLDREKYLVTPVFVDAERRLWLIEEWQLWKNTTIDLTDSLKESGHRIFYEEIKDHFDFVFLALHGKWGEDAFPGLLEILNMPNNSASVLGGALSMDKYRQRLILKAKGIEVPRFVAIEAESWRRDAEGQLERIERELGYPFMVKPSREGSSTGLFKIKSSSQLENALQTAFEYDNLVLAEEVLEGMELTTTVYGEGEEVKALPPSQMYKSGDFLTAEEKFLPGGAQMVTPPPLPPELVEKIQKESIKAFRSLGLKVVSRIDSFLIGDLQTIEGSKVVILEPNNPPAMTPSTALWLQAAEAGMNAAQFLDEIIRISFKVHAEKIGPL